MEGVRSCSDVTRFLVFDATERIPSRLDDSYRGKEPNLRTSKKEKKRSDIRL